MPQITEFVDDLPKGTSGRHVNSALIVDELQKNAGKWGKFYSQGDEPQERAAGRISTLKIYTKRHNLPVEIRQQKDDDGRLHGWARWNGDTTSDN